MHPVDKMKRRKLRASRKAKIFQSTWNQDCLEDLIIQMEILRIIH